MSNFEKKITLTSNEKKDLDAYCKLNNLEEDKVIKDSYSKGFNIERYGLLSGSIETQEPKIEYIEKEIIKYVEKPVEVVKEIEVVREIPVEIIKEIIVEKPYEIEVVKYVDREVIKEIPIEKIVEKIVNVSDDTEIERLSKRVEELETLPPKIVEVIKEIPVEVVKEVVVEKQVNDDSKQKKLEQTLQLLKSENINKDRKISELEQKIVELEKFKSNSSAVYLRGSNLDETLYK